MVKKVLNMKIPLNKETEWLETDGLGGFASGTTLGIRTRRYHSLLFNGHDAAHGADGAGQGTGRLG